MAIECSGDVDGSTKNYLGRLMGPEVSAEEVEDKEQRRPD